MVNLLECDFNCECEPALFRATTFWFAFFCSFKEWGVVNVRSSPCQGSLFVRWKIDCPQDKKMRIVDWGIK